MSSRGQRDEIAVLYLLYLFYGRYQLVRVASLFRSSHSRVEKAMAKTVNLIGTFSKLTYYCYDQTNAHLCICTGEPGISFDVI